MEIAVFSWPDQLDNEHALIKALFDNGLETFHLRKPGWTEEATYDFLTNIPAEWHPRVILHQHFALSKTFDIKGIHFSKRWPLYRNSDWLKMENLLFSCSIHEFNQYQNLPKGIDRIYLSPVFQSISKPNTYGAFEGKAMADFIQAHQHQISIFGLGGIHLYNIFRLKQLGFSGAGILGAIWKPFQKKGFHEGLKVFQQLKIKAARSYG